eukprot:2262921-Amphidinium_carterae.1
MPTSQIFDGLCGGNDLSQDTHGKRSPEQSTVVPHQGGDPTPRLANPILTMPTPNVALWLYARGKSVDEVHLTPERLAIHGRTDSAAMRLHQHT